MYSTSSLRQLRTEADDDVKMATGNDPDEIAEGRTCVNNRSSRFFQEPYAAQDERGFFHCPFAYKGNCKHEPKTKKCDYE